MPETSSTGEDATPERRAELRAAYRAAWRERLLGVLTADWIDSPALAARLGETNAKVLERMRDLVKDGTAEERILRLPSERPSAKNKKHGRVLRAYFRLNDGRAVAPPAPPPQPRAAKPAPPPVRRDHRVVARLDPQVRAALDATARAAVGSLSEAQAEAEIAYVHRARRIAPEFDREILFATREWLRRRLDDEERRYLRKRAVDELLSRAQR